MSSESNNSSESSEQPPLPQKPASQPTKAPKKPKKQARFLVAEKEAFKFWLALPSWERDPKTHQDLAAKLGVHPTTLSDWKQDDGFMEDVYRLARTRVRKEYSSDVYHRMGVEASGVFGNAQDRKLFLEYFEKWAPKQQLVGADGGPLMIVRAEEVKKPKEDGKPTNHQA